MSCLWFFFGYFGFDSVVFWILDFGFDYRHVPPWWINQFIFMCVARYVRFNGSHDGFKIWIYWICDALKIKMELKILGNKKDGVEDDKKIVIQCWWTRESRKHGLFVLAAVVRLSDSSESLSAYRTRQVESWCWSNDLILANICFSFISKISQTLIDTSCLVG